MEMFDGSHSELVIESAEHGNGLLIKVRRMRLQAAFVGAFCLAVASQAAISAESPALAPAAAPAPAPIAGRTYVLPDNYDPSTAPPFSNGVMVSGTFYVAGHLGLDPATGQAAADTPTEARLVMEAVKQTLAKADLTIDDLVSVTIYCTDLSLYGTFNEVYKTFFHGKFPARAFIGVDKLVRNARFEVAGVAVQPPAARMRHAH